MASGSNDIAFADRTDFRVTDIFTPSTQAVLNFVEREVDDLNDSLVNALNTPGRQIVIYGESGSGKSTLLLNKLRQTYPSHITTRCTESMSFEHLLLSAFDKLGKFYEQTIKQKDSSKFSSTLAMELGKLKSQLGLEATSEKEVTSARMLPPQLTSERLGELLGECELCWVLEDFHKVKAENKTSLSQTLKLFVDLAADFPSVRIICVGATGTAREVIEYDPEMKGRVAELYVPLFRSGELRRILDNGQRLMNVDFTPIAEQIVQASSGLASVCHALALTLCQRSNILKRSVQKKAFDATDFSQATEQYIRESSDSVKAAFERALRKRVKKGNKLDYTRLILTELATAPIEGLNHNDILARIRTTNVNVRARNVTPHLNRLTTPDGGTLLRMNRDRIYRFVDPLHQAYARCIQGDAQSQQVTISLNRLSAILQEMVRQRVGKTS